MIYTRERLFIEKLFAALRLNDCNRLDISEDNINMVMPYLYELLQKKKMLNQLDELNLLFEEDFEHKYIDVYKVIKSLDPLFAEVNDDVLSIIVDNSLACEIIKTDSMFKKEDIVDIAKNIKSKLKKKDKVKEIKLHAFN